MCKVWFRHILLITAWAQIHSAVGFIPPCSPTPVVAKQDNLEGGYCKLPTQLYSSQSTKSIPDISIVQTNEEEVKFKEGIKQLCEERNISFDKVKNARDLCSTNQSPIKAGRAYRMGKVSSATLRDTELLLNKIGIKTLIDLRSPTELKEDPELNKESVFKDFTSLVWNEHGKVTEVTSRKPSKKGINYDSVDSDVKKKIMKYKESLKRAIQFDRVPNRKERHFVSLINELKYIKGTLRKLRKRDLAKALIQSPGAIVSRRVRLRVKEVFLAEINQGGLPMLNELLLKMGAPGIRHVLDLIADKNRHPIAMYCTAGKDRTGVIAAIVLSIVGVSEEDIVEDYSLSANVYAEINDHTAMVGALSQRNLNPKTFLGAPPYVMRDTLANINKNYGGVNGYLDWIGFKENDREKLKMALIDD